MTLPDWITVVLGALGIVASLFTASRDYRARRVGERIEKLAAVQRELIALGVKGMDKRVDESSRVAAHEALVDRARIAIRRNTAEYVAIASKPNPSRLTAVLLLAYGIGVIVAGIQLAASASNGGAVPSSQASLTTGIAMAGTGLVVFIFGIRHARLVSAAWRRDRASGVNLTTWLDELRLYASNVKRLFGRKAERG